ncbi:MAG: hypothetical protein C5B49_04755 [Bdellovibrio sp.]|nr:MAG: hypothetical protein C5B49_04755 [Bdellovibrio sp.]
MSIAMRTSPSSLAKNSLSLDFLRVTINHMWNFTRGGFAAHAFIFVVVSLGGAIARANVIGSDAQNFNPTTNGLDFVTVQSGRTLDPGILNFGLFFNYAANTLSFLAVADPGAVQNHLRINDRLLSADLNVGMGIARRWDVGLSIPVLLSQEIENSDQVAYFTGRGITELRPNTKFQFYADEDSAAALVASINFNLIRNDPFAGQGAGPTYNLEIAGSRRWAGSWFALNFGHRWRHPGDTLRGTFGFDPLPSQWIYSAAWSALLPAVGTKFIAEIFGSTPSQQTQDVNLSNRDKSNLEALLGVKQDYSENLALHAGGGFGLQKGFATPDYRIYVGLNWTTGPVWKSNLAVIPAVAENTEKPAPKPEVQVYVLSNLKFKFGTDELTEASKETVQQLVKNVQDMKDVIDIKVEGHTDSVGKKDYNLKLSERRALAVKKMLVASIPFDANHVESAGYGDAQPIADNDNYQGRAQNRRVVVTVKRKAGTIQRITK